MIVFSCNQGSAILVEIKIQHEIERIRSINHFRNAKFGIVL